MKESRTGFYTLGGMGTKKVPCAYGTKWAREGVRRGFPNRPQRPGRPSVQGLDPSSSRTRSKEATTAYPSRGWWGGFPEPRAGWAGRKVVLGRPGRVTVPGPCPGRGRPGRDVRPPRKRLREGYLGHGADVRGSGLGSAWGRGRGPGPTDPPTPGLGWGAVEHRQSPASASRPEQGVRRAPGGAPGGAGAEVGRPLPAPPPPSPGAPGPRSPALGWGWPGGRAEPGLVGAPSAPRSSLPPSSPSCPCPPRAPLPSLLFSSSPARGRGRHRSSGLPHTPPLSPLLRGPLGAVSRALCGTGLPGEGRSMEAGPRLTGAHCTGVLCARWGPSPVPGRGTSR